MILDLDIGNSRIKWRLSSVGPEIKQEGVATALPQLMAATIEQYPVDRVRIACVRAGGVLADITESLLNNRQLTVEVASVQRECLGVSVAYADLTRLGVDRWLAMLAAFLDAQGACVVVDCGTAMTIDLIEANGRHLGGYIVPGLQLIPRALTQHTGIRLQDQPEWNLEPGNSTEEAVYHGALSMLISLLQQIINDVLPRMSDKSAPVVYLTGGDALLVGRFLRLPQVAVKQVQGLVFEGLAAALP